jgi:chemotaxis protein histidine kinase CheA
MDLVKRYFELSCGRLDHVIELLSSIEHAKPGEREKRLFDARMELHTIKGDSGMLEMKNLVDFMNDLDKRMVVTTFSKPEMSKIFEGIKTVRQFLDRVGEKYALSASALSGAAKPVDKTKDHKK